MCEHPTPPTNSVTSDRTTPSSQISESASEAPRETAGVACNPAACHALASSVSSSILTLWRSCVQQTDSRRDPQPKPATTRTAPAHARPLPGDNRQLTNCHLPNRTRGSTAPNGPQTAGPAASEITGALGRHNSPTGPLRANGLFGAPSARKLHSQRPNGRSTQRNPADRVS